MAVLTCCRRVPGVATLADLIGGIGLVCSDEQMFGVNTKRGVAFVTDAIIRAKFPDMSHIAEPVCQIFDFLEADATVPLIVL